ncbi:hypothetical protein T4A_14422 [Trichinella pseudospiralis]|uniref:Uncharacterized protein n=1 Tax=Trichinella pseudospiralis TaxID=6337 RepID=A0A0V1DZX0_TRIPS|nr:hypothetical protein T4A_14422 [Trichinella pseudospiralis]
MLPCSPVRHRNVLTVWHQLERVLFAISTEERSVLFFRLQHFVVVYGLLKIDVHSSVLSKKVTEYEKRVA